MVPPADPYVTEAVQRLFKNDRNETLRLHDLQKIFDIEQQ